MTTPSRSIKLPVRSQQVEDLLLWRDPIRSGAALGGVTLGFLVLQFAQINAISTVAYALLSVVLGCFIYNNIAVFAHRPPVPVPALLREGVTESQLRAYTEKAAAVANKGLAYANRLATGREPVLTGVVAGALYFVARLASMFSLVGLLYSGVLMAFSLPKIYELKQDDIDAVVATARTKATQVYDQYLHKLMSRIPRASNATPAESSTTFKKD